METQPRAVTLAQLKMRDDRLSEDFKRRFPPIAMAEIRQKFGNHFIATLTTAITDGLITTEARLVVHSRDRKDFDVLCQEAQGELPDVLLERRFIPPADLRDLDRSALLSR